MHKILLCLIITIFFKITPAFAKSSTLAAESKEVADMIERAMPSVVSIKVSGNMKNTASKIRIEQGTGVVLSKDCLIVSSQHLIADADEVEVHFADGKTAMAEVLGADERSDITILKCKEKGLTPIKLGTSSELRMGETVFAIGNAFGLGLSASSGIISGLSRAVSGQIFDNFIQTDAAINSGNSGGPLLNVKGEMVGMNAAIMSPSLGNVGISFALPVEVVKKVYEDIKEYGHVQKPYIGLKLKELSQAEKEKYGRGVKVQQLMRDSPAALAGLKTGDIITSFAGKKVSEIKEISRTLLALKVGEEIELAFLRDGEKKETELTVGDEESLRRKLAEANGKKSADFENLGFKARELDDEVRELYNIPSSAKGLLVSSVKYGSAAYAADLKMGDLIVKLGQKEIGKVNELEKEVKEALKSEKKAVVLLVENNFGIRFVEIKDND